MTSAILSVLDAFGARGGEAVDIDIDRHGYELREEGAQLTPDEAERLMDWAAECVAADADAEVDHHTFAFVPREEGDGWRCVALRHRTVIERDEIALMPPPPASRRWYIGDPCYVVTEEEWGSETFLPSSSPSEIPLEDGTTVHASVVYTAMGDGWYQLLDEDGEELGYMGVDSGTIGVLPAEICWAPSESGVVVTLPAHVTAPSIAIDDEGVITVANRWRVPT